MGPVSWGSSVGAEDDVSLNGIVFAGRAVASYDAPMSDPAASVTEALPQAGNIFEAIAEDWHAMLAGMGDRGQGNDFIFFDTEEGGGGGLPGALVQDTRDALNEPFFGGFDFGGRGALWAYYGNEAAFAVNCDWP